MSEIGSPSNRGCDRIGKSKESAFCTEFLIKPLDQKAILLVEHLSESLTADKSRALPIDRIGEGHIISGDRLSDGPGSTSHMEKSTGYFLTRSNLGEGSIDRLCHVNLEGLFVGLHLELIDHNRVACSESIIQWLGKECDTIDIFT